MDRDFIIDQTDHIKYGDTDSKLQVNKDSFYLKSSPKDRKCMNHVKMI